VSLKKRDAYDHHGGVAPEDALDHFATKTTFFTDNLYISIF